MLNLRRALFGLSLLASIVAGCDGESPGADAGPLRDAGSLDAGGGLMDAGRPGEDAGAAREDAGRPGEDGGTQRADTGPAPGDAGGILSDGGGATDDAGAGACTTPGTIATVPCGRCGTRTRFCTAAGAWDEGTCEDEAGECDPGTSRDTPCGDCGTQREICNATCGWQALGSCEDEGECTPGTTMRSSEGCATGQRSFLCSATCTYEPSSTCGVDPCPTPGVIESVPCGMCGARSRFCTAENEWDYGECGDEGVCAAGTRRTVSCGDCGTQEEVCDATCAWTDFGTCAGEGECSPGATSTSTVGCSLGQSRPTLCSEACAYEPAGACTMGSGGIGDLCTPGSCAAGLVCDDSTGVSICRDTCIDDAGCAAPTLCFTGDMVCSDDCDVFTDAGCPGGAKCDFLGQQFFGLYSYDVCSAVGTGGQGSVCTVNAQCQRRHSCLLDETGLVGACTQVCDATHPCVTGTCTYDSLATIGFCQ